MLDEQYTRSGYTNPEDRIKFCDSCDMYLDKNAAYNKHVTTLKQRNNVKFVNGEIIKNGSKFDCVICKTTVSQYSVNQHLKTKMHLDNVEGKDVRSSFTDKDIDKDNIIKDLPSSFTAKITEAYCNICNTTYNKKMNTVDQMNIKKLLKRKNLLIRSGEMKLVS